MGYVVADVLGGQNQRSAAIAAMALEQTGPRPSAVSAGVSVLPAPRFEMLGAAPEPLRATAVAPSGEPAPVSPAPSTQSRSSGAAPSARVRPTARPFPTVSPRSQALSPTATGTTTFASETFDSAFSGWPVRPLAGWSGGYENGRYVVRVDGEQPVGIAYPVAADDFRVAVDVAVESGAGGLVIMFQQPDSFVWVGIDSTGSLGVDRIDGEAISTLVPWQPIGEPVAAGAPVRIEIERRGNRLTVSSGGRQLAALQTPPGAWENRYGFAVAPRDGLGVAAFDNLRGERLR